MIERFRPLKSRRQIIHRLPWNWRRICSWSSCKHPRFPMNVPRADVAIKVLNGVTRFRLGILEARLSFVHSNKNAIIVLPQLLSMAAIHHSFSSPLPALAASSLFANSRTPFSNVRRFNRFFILSNISRYQVFTFFPLELTFGGNSK